MKNPCVTCDRSAQSKDNPQCYACEDRVRYVASLGGMHAGVPDAMSNMTGNGYGHGGTMKVKDKKRRCANPECTMRNPQPIGAFGRHPASKDGLMKICRTCHGLRVSAGVGNCVPHKSPAPAAMPTSTPQPKPGGEQPPNDFLLQIDFSGHAELHRQLKKLAVDGFRPIENQALKLIHDGVKAIQIRATKQLCKAGTS